MSPCHRLVHHREVSIFAVASTLRPSSPAAMVLAALREVERPPLLRATDDGSVPESLSDQWERRQAALARAEAQRDRWRQALANESAEVARLRAELRRELAAATRCCAHARGVHLLKQLAHLNHREAGASVAYLKALAFVGRLLDALKAWPCRGFE